MNAYLKKLSIDDGADIYAMLQEMPKDENGLMNNAHGLSYEDFKQWLVTNDNMANGIGLEDWMVPQITYWLYVDGNPVGIVKLRTRLTDKLREDGGHVGYGIAPSHRGKGYGALLIKTMTIEAAALGIDRILLTINSNNTPSIKIAVNNGGIIEKIFNEKHFIWIDCQKHATFA
ncbi:MAG: GNAT family N-acetyltransferase [Defluviitaleaceae bacterium]|nr:GNAT family N-acetyltransferase [Defluviitaleaceae bacterium]